MKPFVKKKNLANSLKNDNYINTLDLLKNKLNRYSVSLFLTSKIKGYFNIKRLKKRIFFEFFMITVHEDLQ